MTEAELDESEEEIDSYLNQMLINFENGDVAASMNGTTNHMVIDVQDDDKDDDAMEEETYEVKDDENKTIPHTMRIMTPFKATITASRSG